MHSPASAPQSMPRAKHEKKKKVADEARLVRRFPAVISMHGADFCTGVAASWQRSNIEMFSCASFFLTPGMCDSPEGRRLSAQLPKQESGTGGFFMPSRFLWNLVSLDGQLSPEE